MRKFHINSKGVPSPCKAQKGKCPYGEERDHFDKIKDAQEYANKMNEKNFGLLSGMDWESTERKKILNFLAREEERKKYPGYEERTKPFNVEVGDEIDYYLARKRTDTGRVEKVVVEGKFEVLGKQILLVRSKIDGWCMYDYNHGMKNEFIFKSDKPENYPYKADPDFLSILNHKFQNLEHKNFKLIKNHPLIDGDNSKNIYFNGEFYDKVEGSDFKAKETLNKLQWDYDKQTNK